MHIISVFHHHYSQDGIIGNLLATYCRAGCVARRGRTACRGYIAPLLDRSLLHGLPQFLAPLMLRISQSAWLAAAGVTITLSGPRE